MKHGNEAAGIDSGAKKKQSALKNAGALLLALFLCHAAGLIGSVFTIKAIPVWYAALQKPPFNPPNWIFAPMWTTLYTMMGVSAYLIWREKGKNKEVDVALRVFAAQLFLNAVWSPVFFGAKMLFPALIIILLLWLSILATILSFRKHSIVAAALLVPYLLWVAFAAILNLSLWLLNRA